MKTMSMMHDEAAVAGSHHRLKDHADMAAEVKCAQQPHDVLATLGVAFAQQPQDALLKCSRARHCVI